MNREIFRNGREAQIIVENWRQEYNNYRPHNSLGYRTPAEFARQYYEQNQVREVKQPVEKAGSLSSQVVIHTFILILIWGGAQDEG